MIWCPEPGSLAISSRCSLSRRVDGFRVRQQFSSSTFTRSLLPPTVVPYTFAWPPRYLSTLDFEMALGVAPATTARRLLVVYG